VAVATAGNDHRLGANEAPPAIISIFMGDELESVIEAIVSNSDYGNQDKVFMNIGANVLPNLPKDTTDRNRTSPFAFTGNKFEFRMPGSNQSIAGINVILNTVVADALSQIADVLEVAPDLESALHVIIQEIFKNHQRIIFNGNGYSDEWVEEAQRRGLLNLRKTPDALPYFKSEENIEMFEKLKVFSREEIISRYEILMEEYVNLINIEALTMANMANKDILPAVSGFQKDLAETLKAKKEIFPDLEADYETETLKDSAALLQKAYQALKKLESDTAILHAMDDFEQKAFFVRDSILPDMDALREPCDELEEITESSAWPFPTYGKLLFGIQ
ncbi:MAG: glutamine synthetase type III, partial [Ileibacterium sp.]|nr:glutamine synthetase type III [Ileibacterium sp.]